METSLKLNDSDQLLLALENVLDATSLFLKRHGIQVSGRISPRMRQIFLSWPVEKLRRATSAASQILQVHLEAEKDGNFDMDDSSRLLVVALSALGHSIDPSLYSKISRSDVIEVYDNDHFQIFRSFNFFRLCNYNLEDILGHEWFELYERPDFVTNEVMEVATDHMLSSRTITEVSLPPHMMRERFSTIRGSFIFQFKYFANIYSGPEQKNGYVVVAGVKPIASESTNVDLLCSKSRHSRRFI